MSDDIAIKVENLTKIYKLYDSPFHRLKETVVPFGKKYHKDFYALNDVSFEIKKGETVGIVGKNGSGKSTLLKIITGVLTPTSGSVAVNGRISALLELGAGFNPEMTGIENIYFNGIIMGYTREEMDAKLDDILSFADIGEFVHQPVKMYSSGMFVRLAFASAISEEPAILIVDEALAVGDIRFQQKCIRKMHEIKETGKSILFVTHDINTVRTFCSSVVWLKDGILHEKGEPTSVTTRYHHYMHFGIVSSLDTANISAVSPVFDEVISNNLISWTDVTSYDSSGEGGVIIRRVTLCDTISDSTINMVQGGEDVVFCADVDVNTDIDQPIAALIIYNRLGIAAIHMNNIIFDSRIPKLQKGQRIQISFKFTLPKLSNGDYMFSIGIANGTIENHIVLQRIHEAYALKVLNIEPKAIMQSGYIVMDNADISIKPIGEGDSC